LTRLIAFLQREAFSSFSNGGISSSALLEQEDNVLKALNNCPIKANAQLRNVVPEKRRD
jgi:hypothetical protein